MLSSILLPDLSFQSKVEIALYYFWIVSRLQQKKVLVILCKILYQKKLKITFFVFGYINVMFSIPVFNNISIISCIVFFSGFCFPLLVRYTVYANMLKYRFG